MKKLSRVLMLASVVVSSLVSVGCSSTPAKEESPIVATQSSASVETSKDLGSSNSGRGR